MKHFALIICFLLLTAIKIQGQTLTSVGSGIPSSAGIYNGTVTYNNEIYASDGGQIYKWDGSNWTSLSVTVDHPIICMYVYSNELYVAGWFEHFNGNPINRIIRYNGTIWQSCVNGILIPLNQVGGVEKMIEYNGELIALGGFIQAGSVIANKIARWNGSTWNTLGSGFAGPQLASIPSMSVYNSELYVFSQLNNAGGIPVSNAAKWDGTNWSPVGTGLTEWPISSTVFNGAIYVGLWIWEGATLSMIKKWDGSSWINIEQNQTDTLWNMVTDLIGFNGCLYVTGLFDSIDGIAAKNIARFDGNNWHPVANGVNFFGEFFTVLNNELYLTGDFTMSGTMSAHNVVKFVNPPTCTTGINDVVEQNNFIEIYPNPSATILNIHKKFIFENNSSFKIINVLGVTVKSMNSIPDMIDIEDLSKGVYNITFENNGKKQATILIKK